MSIEVVGYSETREIESIKDEDGNIISLKPKEKGHKVHLDLKLPDGFVVTTEVSLDFFEKHIFPTLTGKNFHGIP